MGGPVLRGELEARPECLASLGIPPPLLWASQVTIVGKNLPAKAGDLREEGSVPGLGRAPGGGHGNPLQYSCLEHPTDRGALQATVHRVAKRQTPLK